MHSRSPSVNLAQECKLINLNFKSLSQTVSSYIATASHLQDFKQLSNSQEQIMTKKIEHSPKGQAYTLGKGIENIIFQSFYFF